jgi:mono/diheme cytochrome c family protein
MRRFGHRRAWIGLGVLAALAAWWRWSESVLAEEDAAPPGPGREGRVPAGTLLIGAAVLAAVIGGWFGFQAYADHKESVAIARAITGGDPAMAPSALTRYGCAGCHTIPGIPGADGQVAPPLAGLRKRVYVGGVLPNTAENLIGWIVEPQRYSPNSAMPPTGISPAEARNVAAYLYAN